MNEFPKMKNPFVSESMTDAATQRERLFSQERPLLEAAVELAQKIRSLPADPKYPDVVPRALFVGGFVRDALLGGKPKDADMEVYGVSVERLESLLEQLYPGRVNTVGKSFGILKVALGEGVEFDVSIPRRESKTTKGHTGFVVKGDPGMSIEEAARRRDFTINALAADPLTGAVVDAVGGIRDLEGRILRVTDPERFQEDPLRVYRAIQFAARLGFDVDPASKDLMREMVERGDLVELSRERVTEELKKLLLKSKRPSVGFELGRELGLIERHFPQLHALVGVPQEPEWHPEGDVWVHTMMVVDEAAKIIRQKERAWTDVEKVDVMLGALCHDLGKPATTNVSDGRIRSLGHEEAGAAPTREFLGGLSFGDGALSSAVACAVEHLKPAVLYREIEKGRTTEDQYANAIRKLLKRIYPVSWRVLIAVAEADSRGRTTAEATQPAYPIGEKFIEAVHKQQIGKEAPKPLLQGRDFVALGVKPGPRMGQLIREIEDARDRGEIQTKDEALRLAQSLL